MKHWYVISLVALTAALFVTAVRAQTKKTPLLHALWRMSFTITVMTSSYIAGIFADNPELVLFCHGIYVASYIWMLLFCLRLILLYSHIRIPNRLIGITMLLLGVLCTASMVLNTFFEHAFSFHDDVYIDGLRYHFYEIDTIWYRLVLLYAYVIALATVAVLVYKLIHTQSVYRRPYIILLGIFCAILVIDAVYLYLQSPLDLNLFAYVVMGLLLFYFIGVYIPRDMVVRIISYASDSVQSGIICLDDQENLIYTNQDAWHLLGIAANDTAKLKSALTRLQHTHALHEKESASWTERVVAEGSGAVRFYAVSYRVIRDEDDHMIGSYFTLRDKTEETLAYDDAKKRATHDPLTGLYNMDGFAERVEEILHADPLTPRFMLASNIRDFKLVNDLFGLEKGNEILTRMASILQSLCRDNEVCGRLTGDRFVMLLERSHFREDDFTGNFMQLGDLIRSNAYSIHVQIGVYAIEDLSMTVPQMYDRANVAINTLKSDSNNHIVYYSHQMMQNTRDEQQVINGLARAIDNGDLRIYLQPQLDASGIVHGAEALVRWIHTDHGVLLPGHFISVLENAGMIYQLDMAVWEMTCRTLASWRGTDKAHLYISVNISPRDFYYIDIYRVFTELVARYAIEPHMLHLEITETALMNDMEKQQAIIKRLRGYGFEIEIDDFGSGYSSLSLLKDLPVDTLKIDMEFIRETENRSRSRTILESVIQLSDALGMSVISEGIENKAQFEFLRSLGCSRFQGFYFSRPLPVREFEQIYFPAHSASPRSAYFAARTE